MAYKDSRWGGTTIRDEECDNLQISWDYEDREQTQRRAVLLYTPWLPKNKKKNQDIDHSHIELNREQARELRDWLNDFLYETR